ncbi:GntR family transcriptional regulator [Streptomyces sp. SCSIO ZS0520]|uniref:GntR family transcriptional regulator n=1 Tax=Streptomyces sp. SCSIO ZS0520 TaxID=2892996 RepID=UPI0021D926B2|nr:GntR family transcriptional regulator [Streptomyces sp. SCSIO ZS0520]
MSEALAPSRRLSFTPISGANRPVCDDCAKRISPHEEYEVVIRHTRRGPQRPRYRHSPRCLDLDNHRHFPHKAQRVAGRLEQRLKTGQWRPGEVYSHDMIAELYGCGRGSSVRAVAILRRRGLVEVRKRVGVFPIEPSARWRAGGGTLQERLAREMGRQIRAGHYPPNKRLPSQASLAGEFGVGIQTVASALTELHERNLVHSRSPGRGERRYYYPGPQPHRGDLPQDSRSRA